MNEIIICEEFSDAPGGRYRKEGQFSGEEFREEYLYPRYKEAVSKKEKLTINFDNCFGFGTSFLEEAFGGLVREYQIKGSYDNYILISEDDETIPPLIEEYIDRAEKKLKGGALL